MLLDKYSSMAFIRQLRQKLVQKRYIVLIVVMALLYILFKIDGSKNCLVNSVKYICIEDPEVQNTSGLENVKPLHIYEQDYNANSSHVFGRLNFYRPSRRSNLELTEHEENKIELCVKNYFSDFLKAHNAFWSQPNQEDVRRNHHTYLVAGENIIIEVGGNVGDDAQVFLDTYKPKYYIILEPLKLFYQRLQLRFKNYINFIPYNVGLGNRNQKLMINIEGHDGDASSAYFGSDIGTCSIKIVNASDFFLKLDVGNYKIDLITINCEGCEYELLETLVSTDLIYQFKNIQFETHSKLKNLQDPVRRYCRLQEWLSRSHKLTYQYKFHWEAWKLKDV